MSKETTIIIQNRLSSSSTVFHHPERTLGVVLISGGYSTPSIFDLDLALEASKTAIGYEILGYWKFFEANDAAMIIENNLESFIDLAFASDPIFWKTDLAPVEKVRDWLTNGNRTARGLYMTENDYTIFRQYLAEGMQPKLNWYKASIANIDWNDEKKLDPVIKRPMLFIGGTKDYISLIASYGTQSTGKSTDGSREFCKCSARCSTYSTLF